MKLVVGDSPCTVHIVHVIEPFVPPTAAMYHGPLSGAGSIQDQAKIHLAEFGEQLGVPEEHRHLIFGRPQSEIHRVAEECHADLIVVGSHTHGVSHDF